MARESRSAKFVGKLTTQRVVLPDERRYITLTIAANPYAANARVLTGRCSGLSRRRNALFIDHRMVKGNRGDPRPGAEQTLVLTPNRFSWINAQPEFALKQPPLNARIVHILAHHSGQKGRIVMNKKAVLGLVVCALLLSLVRVCAQEAERVPEDQYFDSNGVEIRYIMKGEGEPIVLTHGFTMDLQSEWGGRNLIDPLAERYKVIAIDNRGHGKSGKPHEPEKYGMEMVKDIVRLLDHLGIDKAHVAGYSMGGFITIKLITTYPDRVQSAIIGGAGWRKDFSDSASGWLKLAESLEQGKGVGPMIEFMIPEGRPKPTQEQIDALNALIAARNDMQALAAVIRGMREMQVTEERLRANKVPALAIIGEIDTLKPGVDEMSAVMANLKVVVIEGADHPGAIASPKFRDAMLEFLARHSIGTPAEPAAVSSE